LNVISRLNRFRRWPRIILLGCALGLLFVMLNLAIIGHFERLAFTAPFKLSDEPVRRDLMRVIDSQLAAFRNGDFKSAYGWADSALRQDLSPTEFREMVRTSYPAIAASSSASCGIVFDNGRLAVVMVSVTSRSGSLVHYQYLLHRERVGWKISGVTRVRPLATTA
jgi:hypothetical protein